MVIEKIKAWQSVVIRIHNAKKGNNPFLAGIVARGGAPVGREVEAMRNILRRDISELMPRRKRKATRMMDENTIGARMDFLLHVEGEEWRNRFHYTIFYQLCGLKEEVHEQVDTLNAVISKVEEETRSH